MNLITSAELKKGCPLTLLECRQEFLKNPGEFETLIPANRALFRVFWKKNLIYLDKTGTYISMKKWNDDYFKYGELFEKRFKALGYFIDERERVRPNE